MKNLILGIGDVHVLLQDVESEVKSYGYDIATLSSYTNVEIVQTVTSEMVDKEQHKVQFIDDRSFHKTPLSFELRFNEGKYELTDTLYIKQYEEFVIREFEWSKCDFLSQLFKFQNIIIVCRLSNFEASYCLPLIAKKLSKNSTVKVLACFAHSFEDDKRFKRCKDVCDKLVEAQIETNILFPADYAQIAGKLPLKVFFEKIDEMLNQSIIDMLSYSDFTCNYVKIF